MPLPTTRRVLLASTALTTLVLATAPPAAADDATWVGTTSGDFSTGANWDSNTVPTGTAFFGTSSTTTVNFLPQPITLGGLTLNAGASDYVFNIAQTPPLVDQTVLLTGSGIVVNGGSATFNLSNGRVDFRNSSTAGHAVFNLQSLNSFVGFGGSSSADHATFHMLDGRVTFSSTSRAGNAFFTGDGFLKFERQSSADDATIVARHLTFNDSSTAGNANITVAARGSNVFDSVLLFNHTSRAGTATITNNANLEFQRQSSGDHATIINNSQTLFSDFSTGGTSAITNNAGGTVDFSASIGPNGDHKLSAGSIAGAGNYILGTNELTVGGNGNSTEVSGVISGAGGSLVKTGVGTMILSGLNTYGGGTTFAGGTVSVASDANLGDAAGALTFNGGTLQVTGTAFTSTARTINWGAGGGGFDIADAGNTFTVNQALGGGGGLTKLGAGLLALTGANTYTGGTTLAGGTLSVASDANLGDAAGGLTFNGGTLQVTGTAFNSTGRAVTLNTGGGTIEVADAANSLTFTGAFSGTGSLTKLGIGTLVLTGTNTYTGGTTISAGGLRLGTGSSAGAIRGAVNVGAAGTFTIHNADTTGITNLTNAGQTNFLGSSSAATATITNDGGLNFREASTAGSSTITNNVTMAFLDSSKAGNATIENGRFLNFIGGSSADNAHITNRGTVWFLETAKADHALIENERGDVIFDGTSAENATIINNANVWFWFGSTAANATITNNAGGIVDFSGTAGPNGDGKLSAGSIAGGGKYILGAHELTVGGNNISTEVSGIISGAGGSLVKAGIGTLILSGTNTYTGATTVDAGTLSVNGSIASSSGVIVNAGGTLGGTGQLPGVIVNAGGNLAPGNSIGTITVNGNLQFGAGSFYTVEVSPSSSDRTNVTGTATLTGATVRAAALPGSFRGQTYTILNATGGLGGTQFAGLTVSGSFAPARNPHLTYDANSAYLMLDPGTLALGQGASRNQTSVAGAINRAVESGGAPPAGFDTLLNMSSDAAGRALDQLSGESGTQAQTGAFQLGNSFLALLTDVFGTRRDDGGAPLGYANSGAPSAARSAFAAIDKAPAATAPRWDLWGTAFGGGNNLSGDATTGSRDATTRAGAVAAGADYRFAPASLVGFSLAGGATNWSSANGGGASDVFMAGIYGKHTIGPTYIAAAASYANYWMSTTRTVTVAGLDRLDARFNAESFGGRIEGGYRLPARFLDVTWTPYGAIQAQSFRTPDYSEAATTGSNQFALRHAGRTATAIRAELGLNTERLIAIDRGSELSLFGRTAYAHDSVSNPAVAANFAVLGPTGGFTTLGAQPSQNLLLSSAGAEWRLASGVSFLLKADTEWGERSRSYSGTGRIRYTW